MPKVLRSAIAIALLALSPGCSFKHGPKSAGLTVRLVPTIKKVVGLSSKPHFRFKTNALHVTTLDVPEVPDHSVTSLSDIGCVTLNVRGGSIPTSSMCDGGVEVGFAETPQASLNAVFETFIPIGDGLIFEVFGSPEGECPNINGEGSLGSGAVYKLGEVKVNLASNPVEEVVIPIAFEPQNAFNCSREPFDIFYEDFDYGAGSLTNLAQLNPDAWATDSSGTPTPDHTVLGNVLNTISGNGELSFVQGEVDSVIFTRLQLTINNSLVVIGETGSVVLGLADSSDSSVANAIGCTAQLDTVIGPFTNISLFGGFDTIANFLVNTPLPPSSPSAAQGTNYFLCDITRYPDGSINIDAGIVDATGGVHATASIFGDEFGSTADPCPSCVTPFIMTDTTLMSSGSFIADDFLIQQSDVE